MLLIYHPPNFSKERKYIFEEIFHNFFGVNVCLQEKDIQHVIIECEGSDALIKIPDIFFSIDQQKWLTKSSLPETPLKIWNLPEELGAGTVPVIYGDLEGESTNSFIPLDIFGSAFFMLTRYEEYVIDTRDQHGRFPITEALSYRENFYDRAIVNEYIEILWNAINLNWPSLVRKKREFSIELSCDVDVPFSYQWYSPKRAIRFLASRVRSNGIGVIPSELLNAFKALSGGYKKDPNNTFSWMMDCAENENLVMSFYFLTENPSRFDGFCYWGRKEIRCLLKEINERGHKIGLHSSYTAMNDAGRLESELTSLKEELESLKINQESWGGRSHFLRWDATRTWSLWDNAGLDFDSSVTFAEKPGFRTGVCYSYQPFSVRERKKLNLIESPLIFMEVSILSGVYMPLHEIDLSQEYTLKLKEKVRKYGGEFRMLWHNSHLNTDTERDIFKDLIKNL